MASEPLPPPGYFITLIFEWKTQKLLYVERAIQGASPVAHSCIILHGKAFRVIDRILDESAMNVYVMVDRCIGEWKMSGAELDLFIPEAKDCADRVRSQMYLGQTDTTINVQIRRILEE